MSFDVNTVLLAALLVQLSRVVPVLRSSSLRLLALLAHFGIDDPATPSSPPATQAPPPAGARADVVAPNR